MKNIQITPDILSLEIENIPSRFDMAINFYCCVKKDDKYFLVAYYYNPSWNLYYPFYDDINKLPIIKESKSNTYTDKVSGLLSGYLTTDITKILTDADTVALNNAKKYTDGEIVRLNDALVYADGQALLSAKNYTDAVSTQINTLMINGDAAAKDTAINIANANIATLKSTLEAADSAVLVEAKVYTN
jgi:hypothetical protein